MPSMSGWALPRLQLRVLLLVRWFLCPRCRAGPYHYFIDRAEALSAMVSMPSMSGWALPRQLRRPDPAGDRFYALDVGLGFTSSRSCPLRSSTSSCFYALDVGLGFTTRIGEPGGLTCGSRFYALDVGLGFTTWRVSWLASALREVSMPSMSGWALPHSARVANGLAPYGFYALDVGLGFATLTHDEQSWVAGRVSMPSMSGWALQRTPPSTARGRPATSPRGFYALDVGLGFATLSS